MNDLELEKKRLEIEKLKAETENLRIQQDELKKPWYAKPQWWSVLVPFIIGAGTIAIAFLTGIISIQGLKNEKADLERVISRQKDSISYFSVFANAQKDSLTRLVSIAQSDINSLTHSGDSLRAAYTNQNKALVQRSKEKLNQLNQEIYMYEDHNSSYRKLDDALDKFDSVRGISSHWVKSGILERQKKLTELKRDRDAIIRQLKTITSGKSYLNQ